MNLGSKAMLVSLSISMWSARRYDKRVSREVADKHGADEKVGRYNKKLLPQDEPKYQRISEAASQARAEHYKQTLPWADDGARILVASNYMDYTKIMREKRHEFDNAVSEFLPDYRRIQQAARELLNGLYSEEDYPSFEKLEKKFSFKTRTLPIPNGYDFRVALSDIEIASIRKQIEADNKEAIKEAMLDPYLRLLEGVKRMIDTLSDTDNNRFHNTLVTNLRELCELTPKLNLTGDPQLEAFRQQIETGLTGFDAKDLKKDLTLRTTIAERAKEIQAQMAGYCGVAA